MTILLFQRRSRYYTSFVTPICLYDVSLPLGFPMCLFYLREERKFKRILRKGSLPVSIRWEIDT